MDEAELLRQAGLSADWLNEFVVESNKIDPQPGPDGPGSVLYDAHRDAALYAIRMAADDRYATPHAVHELLLPDHPKAGILRKQDVRIASHDLLEAVLVPQYLWLWNRQVYQVIDLLRVDDDSIDSDDMISQVWNLHCEFETIHPYELYNGKVGRILMMNHALLLDIDPWIIPCDVGRADYFEVIRSHESAIWGTHPPSDYGAEVELISP